MEGRRARDSRREVSCELVARWRASLVSWTRAPLLRSQGLIVG